MLIIHRMVTKQWGSPSLWLSQSLGHLPSPGWCQSLGQSPFLECYFLWTVNIPRRVTILTTVLTPNCIFLSMRHQYNHCHTSFKKFKDEIFCSRTICNIFQVWVVVDGGDWIKWEYGYLCFQFKISGKQEHVRLSRAALMSSNLNFCLAQPSSIQLQLSWLGWVSTNFNFYLPTHPGKVIRRQYQYSYCQTSKVGLWDHPCLITSVPVVN